MEARREPQTQVVLCCRCSGTGSAGLVPGLWVPSQKGRVLFPPSPLSLPDLPALQEHRYLIICYISIVDLLTVFKSISVPERTRGFRQRGLCSQGVCVCVCMCVCAHACVLVPTWHHFQCAAKPSPHVSPGPGHVLDLAEIS